MQVLPILLVMVSGSLADEVRLHADAILERQLEDGAIVHWQRGDEITIEPYFGNYSALGLFEAYRITGDDKYLDAAVAWTDWYFEHMALDGIVCDYKGTRHDYRSTNHTDATDSAAATFLVCANARRFLTNDFRYVLREKPRIYKTYRLMRLTTDHDGLSQAKPGYPHKFTMDNAEVYEGLWHARQIARVLRDYSWNESLYYDRHKLEETFAELRGEDDLYAWAKTDTGALLTAADEPEFYPAGLSNLFAVALGPVGKSQAKETFEKTYEQYPDLEACTPDHLYWWVVAARRVGKDKVARRALDTLRDKADDRGLAVDHAHCIRALSKKVYMRPLRPGIAMGSTFIPVPRKAVR